MKAIQTSYSDLSLQFFFYFTCLDAPGLSWGIRDLAPWPGIEL